jgi:type II secretory pathway component HofQ
MSTRSAALKKIERLYGLIENMHAAALQEAATLMHEAEAAIVVQQGVLREARTEAHAAMARGDREDYAVAEAQLSVGGRRQQRLEVLRQAREVATEAARVEYGASRVRRGQIKTVADLAFEAERLTAERRAQTIADDRFLSRLRWSQLQDGAV